MGAGKKKKKKVKTTTTTYQEGQPILRNNNNSVQMSNLSHNFNTNSKEVMKRKLSDEQEQPDVENVV